MKTIKLLLLIPMLMMASSSLRAQSPAVKQLREIIQQIPQKFAGIKGDKISEEDGNVRYQTKSEFPGGNTFIVNFQSGNTQHFIFYRLDPDDATMFKLKGMLLTQYVTELNNMVKSGNYTGEDTKEDGVNVSTIYDKSGKTIMQLRSTTTYFAIVVFA